MLNDEALWWKHQKLLAWGLLLLVVLSGLFFVVLPLVQKSLQWGEEIDKDYEQLSRYRQIANATPEFMAEYQRVQQQGLDTLFYPAGMTSAQVAKELQKTLSTVIMNGNGTLSSSEVMDEQAIGDAPADTDAAKSIYQQVMIKAVFQATPALLREVLHQAYSARPLIFVESLEIKPLEGDEGKKQQLLKVEMQLSTYWRGGEVKREKTD